MRVLGQSLQRNVLLTLAGDVRRARIDHPVCADGAGAISSMEKAERQDTPN